ncbi:CIR protein PIR protein [Plasmodium vinckei lentum]|uniref:CIR protein PIR protein n=1 Tax=Plasmodium vinckei lentum TaxID=138297 RepID=A0A6V7SKK2_PLAVN|nr:CIR protein PIR protein [Plasmodium vinckei lentum]
MYTEACKLFREADEIFNNNFVDGGQFNDQYGLYNQYCPVKNGSKKCDNDYEKIGAIGGYIFMELNRNHTQIHGSDTSSSGRYIEYFIIWMSHILHKISAHHLQSVDQIYKNDLRKYIGNFNFWNLTQNKKKLKNANIATMNMFYVLFKQICETIKAYQRPGIQAHEYVTKGVECNIIYDQLSKFVDQCGPYVEVLDHLKTIYNGLIETAVKEEIHGTHIFDQFKEFSSIDNTNVGSEFKSKQCKEVHKKLIKDPPSLMKNEIKKLKSIIKKKLQNTSKPDTPALMESQTQDDTALANPPNGLDILAISSEAEEEDDDGDDDGSVDGDDTVGGDTVGDDTVGDDAAGDDTISDDSDDYGNSDDDSDGEDSNMGNTDDTTDPAMNQLQQKGSLQSNPQEKTQDSQKETPPAPVPLPEPQKQTQPQPAPPQPAPSQPEQKDDQQKGDQQKGDQQKGDQQKDDQQKDDQQKDGQRTSDTSPKDPSSDQTDSGNMNFQNILSSVKNTFEQYGSSAYKTITNAGNILYEKATSTLENAYDTSKNFASSTINYVRDKFNKALENDQSSKEKKPEPAPSLPEGTKQEPQEPQDPQIPTDQKNDNPQVPHSTQNHGSTNSNQVNPSDPPPEKQPQPSDDQSNKAPNIEIKSENHGAVVKENIPQLVKIKDIYRGYNRPKIVITVILMPIILLIMYKYLSSVWRKESERKKKMKKIINSIGGKRQVQIIINSSSQKKKTNKSINSVHRKKPQLLNIYKLMQADPVPFINLFFLLIFFVYKRKLNYLEL